MKLRTMRLIIDKKRGQVWIRLLGGIMCFMLFRDSIIETLVDILYLVGLLKCKGEKNDKNS